MGESSFPVTNQPLSDQQWGQVTRGIGNGILANGGDSYAYTSNSNANNTITLSVPSDPGYSQAIVSGFYHRMDAAATLSIPAVTKTTTYYIGLVYDPTKHGSATGPVSLSVTTTVPSGGWKVYLPLHEIVREANQLLSNAVTYDCRAYVAPQITFKTTGYRPDPKTMLVGTIATDMATGARFRVNESRVWVPAGDNISVLPSPTSISGPAFTMGQASNIQAGKAAVTTNANGDATIVFNVAMTGLLSVTITPYGVGSGGPRYLSVLESNTDGSRVSFRTYGSDGQTLKNFPHSVSYVAVGW